MTGVVAMTSDNRPGMYGAALASLTCMEPCWPFCHSIAKKRKEEKRAVQAGARTYN